MTNTVLAADTPVAASQPPVAKKIPHVTEIHGMKLVDDYFWLRDKPNPDVEVRGPDLPMPYPSFEDWRRDADVYVDTTPA